MELAKGVFELLILIHYFLRPGTTGMSHKPCLCSAGFEPRVSFITGKYLINWTKALILPHHFISSPICHYILLGQLNRHYRYHPNFYLWSWKSDCGSSVEDVGFCPLRGPPYRTAPSLLILLSSPEPWRHSGSLWACFLAQSSHVYCSPCLDALCMLDPIFFLL